MTINWLAEAKKYEADLLHDLQQWIQIPSVFEDDNDKQNFPMGKANRQALDYFLALGESNGFTSKSMHHVVGHIEYKNGSEIIGVIGHSDVVPVGDDWSDHPFSGKIADGYMYGRGTQDDKGPMMAAFYAMKILRDLKLPLKKTIRIINGTDEESGVVSVDTYFAQEQMPELGFSPDSDFPLIYGEKGLLTFEITIEDKINQHLISFHSGMRANMVPDTATAVIASNSQTITADFETFLAENQYIGTITSLDINTYQLNIEGKSAHGSTPEAGINAAYLLVDFLLSQKIASDFLTLIENLLLHDTTGEKLAIDFTGEMGALTSNVGIVHFKNNSGSIIVNVRAPHEWDVAKNKQQINEMLQKYHATLASFSFKEPLYVPKDDMLVKTLYDVYQKQTGDTTPPLTTGGGTYARPMKKAVAFGMLFPNTEDRMHQKDERVPIEDLLKATAIYAEALYELAK